MTTSPAKISAVARRCHEAAARYGTTFSHVFSRVVRLRAVERFSPQETFLWGLADPALSERELARYVSRSRLVSLQKLHNPMSLTYLTEDKATFYSFCAGAGIATPALYGVYRRGVGWSRDGGLLDASEDPDAWRRFFEDEVGPEMVIKPTRGAYARGLRLVRRRSEEVADGFMEGVETDGRELSLDELRSTLDQDPSFETFVVQERLHPHHELERLSGTPAVQTVRAVTLLDDDRRPQLLFACLKVIVGGSFTDNFEFGRTGNLLADVDLESGRLEPARGAHPTGFGLQEHREHPATGVAFDRFVLPHWPKVRRLALEAAVKLHPLRTIGWDIAITPSGPSVIEGNVWWDPLHNAFRQLPRYLALFER